MDCVGWVRVGDWPLPRTRAGALGSLQTQPDGEGFDRQDRLTAKLRADLDSDCEVFWKQETRRRLAELESGRVQAIPGDRVSDENRKTVGR